MMTASAEMNPADVIDRDVPCDRCVYNLRGLSPAGACPECGEAILVSLAANEYRSRPLHECNPQWLAQLMEGAIALLIALALVIAFSFVPPWMLARTVPHRAVLLGATCTWWVLAWWGVWKLASPIAPRAARPRRDMLRRATRLTGTLYLAMPAMAECCRGASEVVINRVVLPIEIALVLCGAIASSTMWVLVRRHARGGTSAVLSALATTLAILSVIAVCIGFLPELDADDSSLAMMLRTPVIGIGPPDLMHDAIRAPVRDSMSGIDALVIAYVAMVEMALVILLIITANARRKIAACRGAHAAGNYLH